MYILFLRLAVLDGMDRQEDLGWAIKKEVTKR
jgi:hypothetical protein